MKKIINILMFTIVLLLMLSNISVNIVNAEGETTVGESKYKEEEVVAEYDLGYGITERKVIAYSSSNLEGFSAAGSGGGGLNEPGRMYPQSVNILQVPSVEGVKVINYVNQVSYGWGRGTIKEVIKNFEQNNPGWKVLAAINGDFFDINGNHPLPDTTSGSSITNGDVLKNYGKTVVGFTNNGTTNSLIGGKTIAFTEDYYLAVFDNNYEMVAEYKVDFMNPDEVQEGISVYYSVPYFENVDLKQRGHTIVNVPDNSYVVSSPERCIPYVNKDNGTQSFFGKGYASASNAREIPYTQFGVYSTNEELNDYLSSDLYSIRVQKNVVGDYAECDNLTGCGDTLVNNGVGVVHNNKERHPRTMVGVKPDGTIVMVTVDGRQPGNNMYGMTLDELGAVMESLGCEYAYNLDGGGSTTMIIRQGSELVVLNSPSDGSERRDANALLVVVPEFSIEIKNVTDNQMTLSIPTNLKGIEISNVKITVNGNEYDVQDSITISNLTANTKYDVSFNYDLLYHGKQSHVDGKTFSVQMGKQLPTVSNLQFNYKDGKLTIHYDIDDPAGIVDMCSLYYTKGSINIDKDSHEIVIENVSRFLQQDLELVLFANIESETHSSIVLSFSAEQFESFIIEDNPKEKTSCFNAGMFVIGLISILSISAILFIKKKD